MAKEGEAQVAPMGSAQPGTEPVDDIEGVLDLQVCELLAFDVAPESLDGIEIGGVSGKPLDSQPVTLPSEEGLHGSALVGVEVVPDQDHATAAEMPLEQAEEVDEGGRVVAVRFGLEEQPTATSVPPIGQRSRHRDLLPAEGVRYDRSSPFGRPRRADRRAVRDPAFVLEDDPGPLSAGVFFTRGQSSAAHFWMAFSSRSLARRAGRWRLQLRPRRIRHTWPGW